MKQSVESAQLSYEGTYQRILSAFRDAGPYVGGLIEAGGATDTEIAAAVGMERKRVAQIRTQMVEVGQVRDSGQQRKAAGRLATVWEAT